MWIAFLVIRFNFSKYTIAKRDSIFRKRKKMRERSRVYFIYIGCDHTSWCCYFWSSFLIALRIGSFSKSKSSSSSSSNSSRIDWLILLRDCLLCFLGSSLGSACCTPMSPILYLPNSLFRIQSIRGQLAFKCYR